jgi:hypothetical protein
MMADVAGSTLNSSAANLRTAVKGVASGTLSLEFFIPFFKKKKRKKKHKKLKIYFHNFNPLSLNEFYKRK